MNEFSETKIICEIHGADLGKKKNIFFKKTYTSGWHDLFLMMPRKERLFLSLEDRKIKLNKYAKNYVGVGWDTDRFSYIVRNTMKISEVSNPLDWFQGDIC